MRVMAGLVLVLSASGAVWADEIILLSGGRLSGIAREEGDSIIVETSYGIVTLPREQVLSIDRSKRSIVEEYQTRQAALDLKSVEQVWELATWAKDNGLPRQSRRLMQRVVELNPDHEFARRDLGFHRFQGQWLTYDEMMMAKGFVKYRNKWLTPSEQELMVKADYEEQVRKDEERRKRDLARKPRIETNRLKPVVDEQNPAPIFTMAGSYEHRNYYPGYNIYGDGYAPAYGIGTTSDFKAFLENLYGFYGLHPANYVAYWPFYGNTPWKTPPFVPPAAPQPPTR